MVVSALLSSLSSSSTSGHGASLRGGVGGWKLLQVEKERDGVDGLGVSPKMMEVERGGRCA